MMEFHVFVPEGLGYFILGLLIFLFIKSFF
jgi:hypothetical protein